MANLANNPVDTRTFVEICAGLSKSERIELQGEIASKVKRTGQCIYYWIKGMKTPSSALEQARISEVLNRKFNLSTHKKFLFPEKS